MVDESFAAGDLARLFVGVADADVIVTTDQSSEARVRIYLYGRNMDRAREYFEAQRFVVEKDGESVLVRTNRERRFTWTWGRDGGASITVLANVPAAANLEIATSDGNVRIDDTDGAVNIKTSDGDVRFAAIGGATASIRTSDGDITGTAVRSNRVTIRTSDGDLNIENIESSGADIVSSDGDVTLGVVVGNATIRTSDGDIFVDHLEGQEVSVNTSDGEVSISTLVAGSARIHSSDGSIALDDVEGVVSATTSDGNIRLAINKSSEVDVRTSNGDVDVQLHSSLPADLDIAGERVQVASGLAFSGDVGRRAATGRINGGGKRIRARASDGSVRVRSAN